MDVEVFINKLAAADRQLNAAIRMWFLEEEPLAIHTLAASAYGILKDLQTKRGRDETVFHEAYGLLRAAQDYKQGFLTKEDIDEWGAGAFDLISELAAFLRANPGADIEHVRISVEASPKYHKEYWREANKNANFLKHADKDSDSFLAEHELENERLLMRAGSASIHLNCPASQEKTLFVCAMHVTGYIRTKPHPSLAPIIAKMKERPHLLKHVGRKMLVYRRLESLDEQAEADQLASSE